MIALRTDAQRRGARYDAATASSRGDAHSHAQLDHQSARTCNSTPAIRAFLVRPDVRVVRFPSGSIYVFLGDRPFYGATQLEAVEAAMTADMLVQGLPS